MALDEERGGKEFTKDFSFVKFLGTTK